MAWLLGATGVGRAAAAWSGIEFLGYQLRHSEWEGLRYYDLIWPSFMLMVGMAIPFALARRPPGERRGSNMGRVWRRALVLFLLGSFRESLGDGVPRWIELSSALQPIAIAYLVASYLAGRPPRLQFGIAAGILAGHALLLAFVPASGITPGTYEKGRNLVTAMDLAVLGRAHPDGWGTVLSTIPTVANTLAGLLLGQVLQSGRSTQAKLVTLAATGIGCLILGYALSPWIPIIMKLWTTTYALVSIGWSCLLFLAFYGIIDVQGWRSGSFPLVVVGVNALAAYLLPTVVPLGKITGVFVKPIAGQAGSFGPVLLASATFMAGWLILWWMYRRRIFLTA